ncbi:hypothetical protein OG474_41290 [Kribbella sp. NBC_01505]|uniref:acyl-CoA reductase n=1 Tax=Kribbella sp. NBC_01505 TaxID=2903580 RepID=UPI0038631348
MTEPTPAVDQLGREPAGGRLAFGDDRTFDFLVAFGKHLRSLGLIRQYPQLGTLALFLRQGALRRVVEAVAAPAGALRFPRGVIFHVPPSNVDTVLVYVWALAALAGNHNVVRIPSRTTRLTDILIGALNETLRSAHPAIAQTQWMVAYGRDEATTTALSATCDLRVLWGGDDSVGVLRRFPLSPSARDLTFPDRSSFAVISAAAWLGASQTVRRTVAEGLCNDVYWFDQAACASPRAVFWVGPNAVVDQAQPSFVSELESVVATRNPAVDTSMVLQKYVAVCGLAADGRAQSIRFSSNAITQVDLTGPSSIPRHWLGAGTFVWSRIDRLTELADIVERRDQTITQFGFSADQLEELARSCAGCGIDRIVPIGRALDFSPVWDGYELLHEFTRLTTISV